MKKFQYKFESIKKIKETQEKQAQKELAEVELEIGRWMEKLGKLKQEAQKARNEFPLENITIQDVAFHKNHQLVIKRMIEDTEKQIIKLRQLRDKKLKILVDKSKETKIFGILKEKHLEAYTKEQNKIELGQIDEFATQKFIRSTR